MFLTINLWWTQGKKNILFYKNENCPSVPITHNETRAAQQAFVKSGRRMWWLASVVCLTESRFTWEMDLWKHLWGCVSWCGKTLGGTIPCLNSGLWKQKGERGTAHGHFCLRSKCQCFKLHLPWLPSQDGRYPWTVGQKKPCVHSVASTESSIMAVGKEAMTE